MLFSTEPLTVRDANAKLLAEGFHGVIRLDEVRQIENDKFFQTVRGGLVVSLYNQKEVWPAFGYEGESASKGGYISRGFDDITWL